MCRNQCPDNSEITVRMFSKTVSVCVRNMQLSTCIDKCGNIISNATKENLRLFISLRNKIEHRYVPAFDFDIFGECQAMLLNFEELITQKFGDYYALKSMLIIPLQVTSFRYDKQAEAMKKVQSKHYNELKQYIDAYRSALSNDIYSDSKYSFRVFLIPKIGNHYSSSDCAIEFVRYDPKNPEKFESLHKEIALIKEKKVPVANQGKYKPKTVCNILSERLSKKISIALHTAAWKYYGVRKQGYSAEGCKTEFCQFDEAHRDYIYTKEWVDFLSEKFSNNEELEKIRNYR